MKQLLSVILFPILLTAFTVQKFNSNEITQIVLTIPELNSKALQKDLEKDLHNLPGIQFIETSLISKTMVVNYDARKLSSKGIEHILQKWSCSTGELSYHSISLK